MKRPITCPKCAGKLKVNPIGRWFAKFKCGHCGALLQFTLLTNAMGITAAALFAIGASYLTYRGYDELAQRVLPYAVWVWLLLLFMSYEMRGVVAAITSK